MKIRRVTAVLLCVSLLLILLTSCSGYNAVMRAHLSNETNYTAYCGELREVGRFDGRNTLKISFNDYETVKTFLGGDPNPELPLEDFAFPFSVTEENNRILTENGFYDVAELNTPIEITASGFIYMDTNFFFIAAVTYNGTEYLSREDGLTNIRQFLNSHKSLL